MHRGYEVVSVKALTEQLRAAMMGRDGGVFIVEAYFDSSGQVSSSDYVVLAGVAASERIWQDFQTGWDAVLKSRTPAAPYLHMKELVSAAGPYRSHLGWDDAKRQSLLNDCFFYAYGLDKEEFRTFTATIDMTCLRALVAAHDVMPSAVDLLNYYVPSKAFEWFLKNLHSQRLREALFFFDQGEAFRHGFEQIVIRRQKSSRIGNAWHMLKVDAADMRAKPQLQLADLVAWSNNRKHSATPASKWHSMSIFTDAGLPSTRIELDRTNLLLIYKWIRFNPEFAELLR